MPCFPPLNLPVRRYVRGLFRRGKEAAPGAVVNTTESKAHSSTTELPPLGEPKKSEEHHAGLESSSSRSLVCGFCWDKGLFAPGPFQEAWSAQLSYTGFSYTTTWTQIRTSSDEGCHWCKLLLAAWNEGMPQETIQISVGFRLSAGDNVATPKGVQTLRLLLGDTPHSTYYVSTDPDDAAAGVIVAKTRLLQLNSPSACSMANNCIMDCIRNHQRCPPPHSANLPTRVIDCLDPKKPKLHIGEGDKAPYLALSYVRGKTQSLTTTTDNLSAHLAGIDTAQLPRTIRDAIETAHAYGVRYLWVDSLCILQDSEEDRAREIAHMGAIFRDAYFTIVAASAQDASEGFLHDRPPPAPADTLLPFRCPDGQLGTMSLSPVWRQYDGSAEPIIQRGWCFEERLLSPRALVYASHTLQYQCRTATVNVGNAVCGAIVGQRLPDLLFRADADMPPSLSANDMKTLRYSWAEAVGEYSQRSISVPGDKLVAFAAIAELFHRFWKSEYLAGLWRSTLVEDLLWYKKLDRRHPRPQAYRAPSWSWASIDGRVLASSVDDRLDPNSEETETCEIVGCEVVEATPAVPFGAVSSGTLHLRAAMVEAVWNPDSSTPDIYVLTSTPSTSDSPTEPVHIGSAYPDCKEDVQDIWAVPVLWNTTAQYAAGLIVTRADEPGRYRRVGYFHSPEDALVGLIWMVGEQTQDIILV
ncbi:HET-domain-containing protein [Earliella scabrosa]|nr:HET-domain-containing protein [Earliella scabrosa]